MDDVQNERARQGGRSFKGGNKAERLYDEYGPLVRDGWHRATQFELLTRGRLCPAAILTSNARYSTDSAILGSVLSGGSLSLSVPGCSYGHLRVFSGLYEDTIRRVNNYGSVSRDKLQYHHGCPHNTSTRDPRLVVMSGEYRGEMDSCVCGIVYTYGWIDKTKVRQ